MNRERLILLFLSVSMTACASNRVKRVEEADVHFRVAKQLIVKNETVQSMAEAMKAAKLDPDNEEIQNFLGLLYVQRGDMETAEKYFRRAVKLSPSYSEGQNHLCGVLVERKKYDEAIRHCTKAVENVTYATPERAYYNMGRAYERKGDLLKAVEAYKKGLVHNKNFVMSLKALGKIYLEQGQYKSAVTALASASRTCSTSPKGVWGSECPEANYLLSTAYTQLNNKKNAAAALKNCIRTDDGKGDYGKKCRVKLKLYE